MILYDRSGSNVLNSRPKGQNLDIMETIYGIHFGVLTRETHNINTLYKIQTRVILGKKLEA